MSTVRLFIGTGSSWSQTVVERLVVDSTVDAGSPRLRTNRMGPVHAIVFSRPMTDR